MKELKRDTPTPAAVYYHLLRDAPDEVEVAERAKRMGYTLEGNRLIDGEGKKYTFNKDGVAAQLAVAGRTIASGAGGMAGFSAGAVSPVPGGAYLGGASGAMMAGSAYDAAMEAQHPSNTPVGEQIAQARNEVGVELAAGVFGRGVEAAAPVIKSGYTTIKNGVTNAVSRIFNEQPVEKVLNPKETVKELLTVIKTGKMGDVDTMPDQEVLDAAQRMGLELPPNFSSTSPEYKQIVQALKGSGGSSIKQQEMAAIEQVTQEMDDTMVMLGREDVSAMSQELKGRWDSARNKSIQVADNIYEGIRHKIAQSKVKWRPLSVTELLDKKREEGPLIGAYKQLDSMFKGQNQTTYAYLDNIRKNLGAAYGGTPRGSFANESTHELGEIYTALSLDQARFARSFGLDKELAIAQKVTQGYMNIQDKMVDVFGKDLQGTLSQAITVAARGGKTGDVAGINRLLESVPGKFKKRVAANALDSYLTGGKGKLGAGYVERYELLHSPQNKTVREALYAKVPKEVQGRMKDTYTVTKGMIGALDEASNSKMAKDMIFAMDKESGFMSKLFGTVAMAGLATATKVHGAFALKSAMQDPGHENLLVIAADAMLSSPKFAQMMSSGVRGKGGAAAEAALAQTGQWKRWAKMQPQEVQDVIAAQGIFRFFVPEVNFGPSETPAWQQDFRSM